MRQECGFTAPGFLEGKQINLCSTEVPLSLLLDKGSAGSQLKDRDLGIGKAQEEVLLPSFTWGELPHNVPASETSLLHLPKQKDNLGALVLVRAQEMSQQ